MSRSLEKYQPLHFSIVAFFQSASIKGQDFGKKWTPTANLDLFYPESIRNQILSSPQAVRDTIFLLVE
jgi:hypothetical protein